MSGVPPCSASYWVLKAQYATVVKYDTPGGTCIAPQLRSTAYDSAEVPSAAKLGVKLASKRTTGGHPE